MSIGFYVVGLILCVVWFVRLVTDSFKAGAMQRSSREI